MEKKLPGSGIVGLTLPVDLHMCLLDTISMLSVKKEKLLKYGNPEQQQRLNSEDGRSMNSIRAARASLF